MPVVFTPDDEPYLGRLSVFHFDQVISSCLAVNRDVAVFVRTHTLTELQRAACQLVPQGINLALSIRELVRQGYLFGAVVLLRPLVERVAIFSYLNEKQEAVRTWNDGWSHGKRPSLDVMLATMRGDVDTKQAKAIAVMLHHITHGDPVGAEFNLVELGEHGQGYAVGKALSEPELCDFICFQAYLYLIVLMGRMVGCFPDAKQSH